MSTSVEAITRPSRPWWRRTLSVRVLMLLVLGVGLGVGWYARVLATRREAMATIRAAGGKIQYRDQVKLRGFVVWLNLYERTGWEFAREIYRVDLNKPSRQARGGGEPLLPDPTNPPPPSEVFAALGRLGHVVVVAMESGPITPAARDALTAAGVVRLDLSAPDDLVPDESLVELRRIPSLRSLAITSSGRPVLPRSLLRWVGSVPQLEGFTIQLGSRSAPVVFDADASTLSRLADLERLDLPQAPTDGAYLDGLAAGHRLKVLSVPATRPTDAQLRRLVERQPNLERLALDGSLLTDAGTEALERLTQLLSLELTGRPGAGAGITDATLATVGRLKELRTLRLTCGRFTDRGLGALRGASSVNILDLGWFDAVSPAALSRFLAGRPLRTLGFRGPGIDDASLPAILAGVGSGTPLTLVDSAVTDAGMATLAAAPVSYINLTGTKVTDAGMPALARSSVRRLILNRTALTDAGLLSLASATALGQLEARGTPITPAGVAAFHQARGARFNLSTGPLLPRDE